MHSKNFYDYEMKPLTPKPFLQEMLGRESRSPCHSINEDGKLSLRMLTSKGRQEENEEGKKSQHNSKNGRDSKRQSVIRTSPCMTNVLTNTQGK